MRAWNGLRSVLGSRTGIRRVMLAYACFALLEFYVWLVVVLWAYSVGGAGLAGVVALAQLLPASLLAPAIAGLGDRLSRGTALAATYSLITVGAVLTCLALACEAPILVVLIASTWLTTAIASARPVHFATLPDLARAEPERLVAANSLSSIVDGIGRFVGPVLAGLVVDAANPAVAMAGAAAVAVLSPLLCVRLPIGRVVGKVEVEELGGSVIREALEGFAVVRRTPAALALLLVMTVDFVLTGVLDILGVAFAEGALDAGGAASGVVVGAMGIGALFGAFFGSGLSQRRNVALVIVGGAVLEGLAFATTAASARLLIVVGLLAVAGLCGAITIVAGRTLLQRTINDDVLARVFAVQESVSLLGLAIGSILAPVLIGLVGLRLAWLPLGIGVAFFALLALPLVRSLDRVARWLPEEISLLRQIPFIDILPPHGIEQLAHEVSWRTAKAGELVVEQGVAGDDLFVVAEGELSVWVSEQRRPGVLVPGRYFGEVAMLRGNPRSATVVAETPTRLLVVPRMGFVHASHGDVRATELAIESARAYQDLA